MPAPYISRPIAEAFLSAIAAALKAPAAHPVVFHIWGTGGVGKSTLLNKLIAEQTEAAVPAIDGKPVKFGETEGIDRPIELMHKLHELLATQFPTPALLQRDLRNLNPKPDPFAERYQQYFDTLHQLESQATDGKGAATPEQVNIVKKFAGQAATVGGNLFAPGSGAIAGKVAESMVEVSTAIASEADRFRQIVQQHHATKTRRDLQVLMLDPIPGLTEAFVASLVQWSRHRPIVLLLDTYEKVPIEVDTWLWRSLLANTTLRPHPIRLVVAGRYEVLKTENWRKLQQDHDLIEDYPLSQFDRTQTQDYLTEIGITNSNDIQNIFRVTKGLPYYLNWIRQERRKGRQLDFAQGNQEIVRLLLQGLDDTQKLVVQLAACCRQFDRPLIVFLMQQQHLPDADWHRWLIEQSFVEPVKHRCRLDDVARDVFRLSLWHDDPLRFEQVHTQLAMYFKGVSDRAVPSTSPPPAKYNNPDWRDPRANYLYHLLLTRQANIQRQFLTHLLEARYFNQDELVQTPLSAIEAEEELAHHRCLSYPTQQFLLGVKPAVEQGWAVLEEDPINYAHNQKKFGLSKEKIDRAIQVCLGQIDTLAGLAKFAALFYKAKRGLPQHRLNWLLKAQTQAEQLVTAADPDFSSGLFLWKVGNALFDLGRYSEAVASYDRALKFKPDNHQACYNGGVVLSALGRKEAAVTSFDKALEIKPDDHETWIYRGVALSDLGRKEAAIESYGKALEFKPDLHEAWYNQGNALSDLERKEAAIESYDRAVEIKPDYDAAWNNRGVALSALGRKEAAIESYDRAVEIKPDFHEAWNNRGVALSALGRNEDAIESYKRALELKPDYEEAWYNRGYALDDLGRILQEQEQQEEALSKFSEAIESYNKAIEINPDDGSTYYNKACCHGLQGDVEQAVESLRRAIDLDAKYREMAKTDTDFDAIRDEARFQALVEGADPQLLSD